MFTYYLWGIHPLKGDDSSLQRFYDRTESNQKYWANLFSHVGILLTKSSGHLTDQLRDKVIEFFEWRLKSKEQSELKKFAFWLEAKCLDARWRLQSYSKILDICITSKARYGHAHGQVTTLVEMREEHPALVLECFAKLVDIATYDDYIYIRTDEAKAILETGLNSSDTKMQEKAESVRDKLILRGHLDLWNRKDK